MNLEKESYAVIGTLESWNAMKRYFGDQVMVPVYVEVEDGERLSRALVRERRRQRPVIRNCAEDSWRTQKISQRNI